MSNVTFACTGCGKKYSIESDDYETFTESDERPMGTSTEYWTEIDMTCSSCGNEMNIVLNDTEYPVGYFQGISVNSSSGVDGVCVG